MSRRGNSNNKGRHRRMFELTGVPGWVRYGSSPGFAGGGRGMGPCAEYLQKTGQMDDFLKELSSTNPNIKTWQNAYSTMITENPDHKKKQLEQRIQELEDELKDLKKLYKEYR